MASTLLEDSLTGLKNRGAFERVLKQSIESGAGVAVGLIDIDNFHAINIEFGHDVGDAVLRQVATFIRETAGNGFRLSGDEFAVVMDGASLEQGFLRMEQLRSSVEKSAASFGVPDSRAVYITVGVAQSPRDAKDVHGLMEAADAALQSAKEGGRNMVALPSNEEMVMKSCYYPATQVRKLKALAERLSRKESQLSTLR